MLIATFVIIFSNPIPGQGAEIKNQLFIRKYKLFHDLRDSVPQNFYTDMFYYAI